MISSSGKLGGHRQHHIKYGDPYHCGDVHMRFTSEKVVTEPGVPSDPKVKGSHPTIQ